MNNRHNFKFDPQTAIKGSSHNEVSRKSRKLATEWLTSYKRGSPPTWPWGIKWTIKKMENSSQKVGCNGGQLNRHGKYNKKPEYRF